MSNVTVGSIQTYVTDSILASPTVSQDPVQERVSVTLTDSNLWLVDTSTLNGQTVDPGTQFTLLNLQTKYQVTVPFDNINFTAATIAPATLANSRSSYLQTNLPQDNALALAQVTGGSDFGVVNIPTITSSNGGTSASPASPPLPPTSTSSSGSQPPSASPPGSTSDPQPTASPSPDVGPPPPVPSPPPPVPVPFDVTSVSGLLIVLAMFGYSFCKRHVSKDRGFNKSAKCTGGFSRPIATLQ